MIENAGGNIWESSSPSKFSPVFLEVLHLLLGVGDDGVGAGFPTRRTDLAVLVGVLRNTRKVTIN